MGAKWTLIEIIVTIARLSYISTLFLPYARTDDLLDYPNIARPRHPRDTLNCGVAQPSVNEVFGEPRPRRQSGWVAVNRRDREPAAVVTASAEDSQLEPPGASPAKRRRLDLVTQSTTDAMSAEDSNTNSNPKGSYSPATTPRPASHQPDPVEARRHSQSPGPETIRVNSPPTRKDTMSSTSTLSSANNATVSVAIDASATSTVNAEQNPVSPIQSQGQNIFSARDGADIANNRRASRRRTGPLSQQQREKAALIRKLGACHDCRRRRVACHPSHHNMTWEEAMRKYRSSSPGIQDIAPMARPLSPAPSQMNHNARTEGQGGEEMEIDSPPAFTAPRPYNAASRTPLPSGPSVKRPSSSTGSVIEPAQSELQNAANRILKNPTRGRYSAASVLMLCWEGDEFGDINRALKDLNEVFRKSYRYDGQIATIPPAPEGSNPWRWLMTKINEFMGKNDSRDSLKIIVYNGHSYLDSDREMVLASASDHTTASTIRWSGIQQVLEEACSDTLVIMDSAYHPSTKTVRHKGMLEFIAAVSSEEHLAKLGRTAFTKKLTTLLRARAIQTHATPFTAAELHAKLHSEYPGLIGDYDPSQEILKSYPAPIHMQVSDNNKLPSIFLAPLNWSAQRLVMGNESQLTLTFKLSDASINFDSWVEWFRTMPEEIKEAKVEGPTRPLR
ncbi:Tyrosine-protein phosphatase non-receptor type 6 [Zalerion maritima]|uniref:Tyrosine-protein phosphatase non-receptor type 6 n=1 Tax=Zalerion maritima TaxID=339359 RepID=A0AAD5RRD6_9PEZI|nr:Tyrosine-protein phosphatase non-receptor type 6 [Zalerion maritima]